MILNLKYLNDAIGCELLKNILELRFNRGSIYRLFELLIYPNVSYHWRSLYAMHARLNIEHLILSAALQLKTGHLNSIMRCNSLHRRKSHEALFGSIYSVATCSLIIILYVTFVFCMP